ncbi:MAG TPA: cytochrome c biogenesis heme-transporting ATPase CcmA [Steroidobacteraceae bacterium]|jgi:heme exporter protein A|nr:cytochrome c biogenesis heme-transporting ATPase CcmA [Steroidobacteraceae bacterium]
MNMSTDGLSVDKVHVWRGDRHVLQGVSAKIDRGELLHVSGPNGAGKTTLLRVISGLLRPEQGNVAWLGRSIIQHRADYQAALAYAAHEPALKGDLTAMENLRFSVGLKRRSTPEELRGALQRTGVAACADLPARVLSAGQRRRVSLARVVAMQASVWLLDEPYANLDTEGSELVSDLLQDHVAAGGLALVVAHRDLALTCQVRRLELNS